MGSIGHRSCEKIIKEKHLCWTNFRDKLPLSQKQRYFKGSGFPQFCKLNSSPMLIAKSVFKLILFWVITKRVLFPLTHISVLRLLIQYRIFLYTNTCFVLSYKLNEIFYRPTSFRQNVSQYSFSNQGFENTGAFWAIDASILHKETKKQTKMWRWGEPQAV